MNRQLSRAAALLRMTYGGGSPSRDPRNHWWMTTSSNGNIFRVTGPLCGEFTGPGEFPTQRPVTRSFDVFFDMRPNKRLSKQSWGWWFETPSLSLLRHRNGIWAGQDDVVKWKRFPHYRPFMREIHKWQVDPTHVELWLFSLLLWIKQASCLWCETPWLSCDVNSHVTSHYWDY